MKISIKDIMTIIISDILVVISMIEQLWVLSAIFLFFTFIMIWMIARRGSPEVNDFIDRMYDNLYFKKVD